ncbi:MAG: transglutaminase domain-containing protein [Sulfurovum sp.]|nr:transglutaminase domain-containing protein [Sulfurovum sp.]
MPSTLAKNLSIFIMGIAFLGLVYATISAIDIVSKTQIGTDEGIYTSYVSNSKAIQTSAHTLTKDCSNTLCKVQSLLDYVTHIPYSTQIFQRYSAHKTMSKNMGDCDDKSNLLLSLLHAIDIEAYFVLVPKHIFVIVPLNDTRIAHKKGLWINGRKYYILETTAKDSKVGFALQYKLKDIHVILEPFSNEVMEVEKLGYKI